MKDCCGIVAFLEGEGPDPRGRTLFDLLALDDVRLESSHDVIQWRIHRHRRSVDWRHVPLRAIAPIHPINRPTALAAATDRLDAFYRNTFGWLMPSDHNHRRITRIIRSLRLLRGDDEADAFRAAILARIEATRAPVSARSRGYWMTA